MSVVTGAHAGRASVLFTLVCMLRQTVCGVGASWVPTRWGEGGYWQ